MRNYLMISACLAVSAFFSSTALAKLSVVTTTTDLKALTDEVGGALVTSTAIAKGTQDPHFIEAKPSYMTKVHKADLLLSVGLDLEIGWLPSLIRGARNPKVNPGTNGYLELGPMLNPIEVIRGTFSRAQGDVHPFGNPHVNLDPIRMGEAALIVAERMGRLDPRHADAYAERAKAFRRRMQEKAGDWEKRLAASGVGKLVTYHKTLNYFVERFHIEGAAVLEPKPGIPPTSRHILEVIDLIKTQRVPLILVENFFDPAVTRRIKEAVPSIRVASIPAYVGGEAGINTLDDLYEHLVRVIERK